MADIERFEEFCECLKTKRSNTMEEQTQKCECEYHGFEQGDTLYFETQWDGGIEFYYIRDIKYCPVCGKELTVDKPRYRTQCRTDLN